ncbi:four helix bundle protein [Flavobacterium urocaniciphilum]|uniref:Four helix bundle protein n=1 Tax=Flavobacterium urocaniciphilum TaxID=1299341 RepID=A0A1H8YXR8_9FLAO|nr:four helix bundle protein [Flavobacterium urocaniciphilum]SEP56989.1 four helix bundle protein [Flavobacterium urocaniciphilum]
MKTFRDLLIWQKSMSLVTKTYILSSKFPKDEQFGLMSQIRRCSVSVPSNIAEGFGRDSNKDFYRFLKISIGSLFEFQTQIEIAFNLNYISENEFKLIFKDSRECERMMSSFMRKIKENL